jgi:diphthamide biosynthesis protein 4
MLLIKRYTKSTLYTSCGTANRGVKNFGLQKLPPTSTLPQLTKHRALLPEHLTMTSSTQNYYTTLNLSPPTSASKPLSAQDIKTAYRLALLSHHPDKSNPVIPIQKENTPSIDAIKTAYTTLSTPSLRKDYDRTLLLLASKATSSFQQRTAYTGSETLDLDDLSYDEESGTWFLACRCGENRGYVVTEGDLEREELAGGREIVVGCGGCSLWIRVAFVVVDEGEGEVKQEG